MKAFYESDKRKFTLDKEYSINRVRTRVFCPEHTHGYVELVYNFRGKAIHKVDGMTYTLGKGDLLFVNYGSTHTVEPQGVAEYADIMLKPEFLDGSLKGEQDAFSLLGLKAFSDFSGTVEKERHLVHFQNDDRRQVEYLIGITLSEQNDERSGAEHMRRSALNMLLSLVFRNMVADSRERMTIDEGLLVYIREHCNESLTLSETAKRCYYTPEHFSRSFKKYTGKNFTEYLNECRIEEAKTLLSDTDKTVEDIFLECGFSNRTGFFKSFSEATGHTPAEYRKISKKGTFINQ